MNGCCWMSFKLTQRDPDNFLKSNLLGQDSLNWLCLLMSTNLFVRCLRLSKSNHKEAIAEVQFLFRVYGQTMLDSFKTDFQVVDKPQTEVTHSRLAFSL